MLRHRSFVLVAAVAVVTLGLTSGCPTVGTGGGGGEDACAGVVCDDGDLCTADSCSNGSCVFAPVDCPSGETCSSDTGQCGRRVTPVCTGHFQCDDGDACTDDACIDGDCVFTEVQCASGETCVDGECVPAAPCTEECDFCALGTEWEGDCPLDWNGQILGDGCDCGCQFVDFDCTLPKCDKDADCDDGNPCTADACGTNPDFAGFPRCVFLPLCPDSQTCIDGVCVSDGIPCTEDADCDDGFFCNGTETCGFDGTCLEGTPPCGDGETCNEDVDECPPDGTCYRPGQPVARTIPINPPSGTFVYGVEDTPPAGWTVSEISDDGEYDAGNNAVKWFFLDDHSRTLTYTAIPPGSASGNRCFSGQASFDGGANQAIAGGTCIDQCSGG